MDTADRKTLIRLASGLPKGSKERKTILTALRVAVESWDDVALRLLRKIQAKFSVSHQAPTILDLTFATEGYAKMGERMLQPLKDRMVRITRDGNEIELLYTASDRARLARAAWSQSHAADWLKRNKYKTASAAHARWTAQFVNDKRATGVLDRFIFPALHGELRRQGLYRG